MTDTKHTEGKWQLDDGDKKDWCIRSGNKAICWIDAQRKGARANANLIEAAPSMLKELEKAHHMLDKCARKQDMEGYYDDEFLDGLQTVIAEAKGE